MSNLRRIAVLTSAERRELALEMAERDWINEWGLCLRYSAAILFDVRVSTCLTELW